MDSYSQGVRLLLLMQRVINSINITKQPKKYFDQLIDQRDRFNNISVRKLLKSDGSQEISGHDFRSLIRRDGQQTPHAPPSTIRTIQTRRRPE